MTDRIAAYIGIAIGLFLSLGSAIYMPSMLMSPHANHFWLAATMTMAYVIMGVVIMWICVSFLTKPNW